MSLLKLALAGLCTLPCVFAATNRLTVVYSAGPGAVESVFSEIERETASLVEPAGYALDWLAKGSPGLSGPGFDHLVVVQFQGSCSMAPAAADSLPAPRRFDLATTAISDGQVLPFVRVDCDRTRRVLAPAVHRLPAGAQSAVFGRALGRIVAHELYHVLSRSVGHGENGVSKTCFRAADLVSDTFRFETPSLLQMRAAIPAPAAAAEPAASLEIDEATGRD